LLDRTSEVGRLAPIAAASFLWREMEQKDIAESGESVSNLRCRIASKQKSII